MSFRGYAILASIIRIQSPLHLSCYCGVRGHVTREDTTCRSTSRSFECFRMATLNIGIHLYF